ncbi:MAG: hypothetical protein II714_02205, partial [Oscillospiraceae bacterium]|nr:hypothetical protein [Oscillospiraceae bacterium]
MSDMKEYKRSLDSITATEDFLSRTEEKMKRIRDTKPAPRPVKWVMIPAAAAACAVIGISLVTLVNTRSQAPLSSVNEQEQTDLMPAETTVVTTYGAEETTFVTTVPVTASASVTELPVQEDFAAMEEAEPQGTEPVVTTAETFLREEVTTAPAAMETSAPAPAETTPAHSEETAAETAPTETTPPETVTTPDATHLTLPDNWAGAQTDITVSTVNENDGHSLATPYGDVTINEKVTVISGDAGTTEAGEAEESDDEAAPAADDVAGSVSVKESAQFSLENYVKPYAGGRAEFTDTETSQTGEYSGAALSSLITAMVNSSRGAVPQRQTTPPQGIRRTVDFYPPEGSSAEPVRVY